MGFVKKNAFLLGCAVVGVAGLGLMFWGMSAMSTVKTEMASVQQLHSKLSSFSSGNPSNPQAIKVEQQRSDTIKEHYDAILAQFSDRTERKPLVEGVLPIPTGKDQFENNQKQFAFQDAYIAGMNTLLSQIKAGRRPTREEVDETRDLIKRKQMQEAQFSGAGSGNNKGLGRGNAPELTPIPEIDGPESSSAYWRALEARAKQDPAMLTSIGRARDIWCYAKHPGCFQLSEAFNKTGQTSPPSLKALWYCQLWYWVQEEIVDIISTVNLAAAAEIKAKGEEPWVGNLPIKELKSVQISPYILPKKGKKSSSNNSSAGGALRDPGMTFTGLEDDPLFSVLNLRVVMVTAMADLPQLLNEISNRRYNVVLNISYESIEPNSSMVGRVYGSDPVVRVTLDLQNYMLKDALIPLMPEAVRDELGISEQRFKDIVAQLGEQAVDPATEDSADASSDG